MAAAIKKLAKKKHQLRTTTAPTNNPFNTPIINERAPQAEAQAAKSENQKPKSNSKKKVRFK